MQIAEFQRWTRDTDRETQWDLITTPQLISHLTEEMGEVAQSVNRIYGYAEEKKKLTHQANLGLELIEVFWFLAKIANRFSIDLDAEASDFIENADEWQGKYFDDLVSSLRALDQELAKAKNGLDLRVSCVAAILRNAEGRVLLQQRGDDPDVPFAGYWTLPGGKVEDGETPEAAIGRELMEEIEIKTSLELWKVYERPASDLAAVVQYVYVGQIGTPISSLAINEGQALRYCTSEEIEKLPIAYGFGSLIKECFCR